MDSTEIRSAFLKFFEEKGHKVIPSSSLIPVGDPTLLLTNAGMVQIKPYFLGEAIPPSRRLASCQKCFRTSDIESVGDSTHLTFFEMLGNFSVGDYFKKEAIAWAWEFLTERMKIAPEKLWITIYLDDDEAYRYWREVGIPEGRIFRFGEKENFWGPAGSSGPCGPCSEIHYDFGIACGCGRAECKPNCACGRFTELWNLVFTQYNQDEKGNRTPLPRPNIDTGMGLERLVTVMQDKRSVYETDLFASLIDGACSLTGGNYGTSPATDTALRVVTEHARALAFLIADGVLPDNEGRGYVLRRLLRRAALFGRRLGLESPFLSEVAQLAINKMGSVYPELELRREFIRKVIELEEARFAETLTTGLEIIEEIIAQAIARGAGKISGKDVFKLYDTYGFPVELTREVLAARGFSVDMADFEEEMARQRERARAAHKFDIVPGARGRAAGLEIGATRFVGYDCTERETRIIKLLIDGREAGGIRAGDTAGIVLAETPFYGEMGGQVGDTGEITDGQSRFVVTNTVRMPGDVIVHQGKLAQGSLKVGDMVRAIVDDERRRDIARNHTATHLLQAALRQVLGGHVQQRGSLVAPERLRFDFSHLAAMTDEEIRAVQRMVNMNIRQNLRVYDEEMEYRKALAEGAIALFDEKYGDTVRVLRIGKPAISTELCGGTHVGATGEIGYFHIVSEGSIGAGLRRIEAVTGRFAEEFIEEHLAELAKAAAYLDAGLDGVAAKAKQIVAELEDERRHVASLERELALREAKSLARRRVKDITLISGELRPVDQPILRDISDELRREIGSGVVALGTIWEGKPALVVNVSPDLVARGVSAVEIARRAARAMGGGGGGKAGFAQAGGKDRERLADALRLIEEML